MSGSNLIEATMQLPCSVVVLSASPDDKQGAMTACAMYVSQSPPLISGCVANIECRVKDALWDVEGNHAIYIGEVVAFRKKEQLKPAVWLNNKFFSVGAQCRI